MLIGQKIADLRSDAGLTQEQLATALFPIGDIVKPEVRRLAHEADLPSADKKDSQGICFVGKVDLPTFLQQKLESREGSRNCQHPSGIQISLSQAVCQGYRECVHRKTHSQQNTSDD